MSEVIFYKLNKSEIDASPITDGAIYFQLDGDHDIYLDNETTRIKISSSDDVIGWLEYSYSKNSLTNNDTLNIDSVTAEGNANKPCIVLPTSSNKPSNFSYGVREVKYYSQNGILVRLYGVDGNGVYVEWANWFNGRTWNGWTRIATSNDKAISQSAVYNYIKTDNTVENIETKITSMESSIGTNSTNIQSATSIANNALTKANKSLQIVSFDSATGTLVTKSV